MRYVIASVHHVNTVTYYFSSANKEFSGILIFFVCFICSFLFLTQCPSGQNQGLWEVPGSLVIGRWETEGRPIPIDTNRVGFPSQFIFGGSDCRLR
jgi:hypothetical protein